MLDGPVDPANVSAPLQDENGNPTTDPEKKAKMLFDVFCPIEERREPDPVEQQYEEEVENAMEDSTSPINSAFNFKELNCCIRGLPNSAMGLDRIHNAMIKNLSKTNREALLHLYNLLFQNGVVPDGWKSAAVIPIPKAGKPLDKAESYRPISLTSCLGKTMEKMLNNRIKVPRQERTLT